MEGTILSSWDYIMGPQIERLWFPNHDQKLNVAEVPISSLKEFNLSKYCKQSDLKCKLKKFCDLKTYSLMCGQLLLGEINTTETLENASRIYISDSKVLISILFHLKSWNNVGRIKETSNSCLCIGLLYKRDALNFIFQNQFTIDMHLRKMADILQISKLSHENVYNELSCIVMTSTSYLDSLYYNSIHCIQHYVLSCIEDYVMSNIIHEAVVSHLQTSGHTVVLGASECAIDQVINILSLFGNKQELSHLLPISYYSLKSKVSAAYIQGVIKTSERDCEHLLEHAFDEFLSLTVIDTDFYKVWQTWPHHEIINKKKIFSLVTETGCFVPQLLKDLSFANKNSAACELVVENFMNLLMMKAVAMVKTISCFRNTKKIPSKQELMKLFAIQSSVDLQIILGCAEKLKPGIRCSI